MKKLNKKGFTIVELVIVIGVIGILSAILIPTFVNLTSQAKNRQIQSNLRNAYAAYIADVVDGESEIEDYKTFYFENVPAQEKVALSATALSGSLTGAAVYTFDGKDWGYETSAKNVANVAWADSTKAVAKDVKYGDYYIYKLAA